jgi:hypothetical protein
MQRTQDERLEDQEVQRALEQIGAVVHAVVPARVNTSTSDNKNGIAVVGCQGMGETATGWNACCAGGS